MIGSSRTHPPLRPGVGSEKGLRKAFRPGSSSMAAPGAKCSTSVAAIHVEPGMKPLLIVCTSCGASVISTSKRPDVASGAISFESVTRKRSGDLGPWFCAAVGNERKSAQRAEQTKLARRSIEEIPLVKKSATLRLGLLFAVRL